MVEHLDVFGTKYYPMLPGGTSVHWHQDGYYFGTGGYDPVYISCAIYLEQTTKENGCLRLIPKSKDPTRNGHGVLYWKNDGIIPHTRGTGQWAHGDWIVDCPDTEAIDVEIQKGLVVVFDPRIVHSALPKYK